MKQDPLITYSSLIRGGLHLIPGGFDRPTRERVRHKDLPPEPHGPRSTPATTPADAVWARLGKIHAAFFSRAVAGGKAPGQLELDGVGEPRFTPAERSLGHRDDFSRLEATHRPGLQM